MPTILNILQSRINEARSDFSQIHAAAATIGKNTFYATNGERGGCHSSCHAEQNALRTLFASLRAYELVNLVNDKSHWAKVRENPAMVDRLSKVPDPEV